MTLQDLASLKPSQHLTPSFRSQCFNTHSPYHPSVLSLASTGCKTYLLKSEGRLSDYPVWLYSSGDGSFMGARWDVCAQ